MWFFIVIGYIIFAVVIGKMDDKWREERGIKSKEPKPKRRYDYYDDDDDEEYVTRAKRRREEARKKRKARFKDDPKEDYGTYTDKDGNEHSVDYYDYCDECDEYHEE